MKSIGKAVELSAQTTRDVFKRNLTRFAAVLLAALAGLVAVPNVALAAPHQHHDQVPGFYRLKVGDLEVTALYDGTGVFDPHWLNGTKATMDGVVKALQEDPHVLDVVDSGFLVNTGKQLILVDAGAGTWWGGEPGIVDRQLRDNVAVRAAHAMQFHCSEGLLVEFHGFCSFPYRQHGRNGG
jgi:hypothetical protein